MSVKIIVGGDKSKQGNASCPQCNEKVLIENQWGDPPKCPNCNVPYRPCFHPTKYEG